MAIEPVKIPQNVYIEDRIIGPLTLRQTMMIFGGGGISYALYSLATRAGQPSLAVTIILWMPAMIATAFAIIKINDLTLARIVLLSLERMQKAPVRTWSPRRGLSITIRTASVEKSKDTAVSTPQAEAQRKIRELSSIVDQPIVTANALVLSDLTQPAPAVEARTASAEHVESPASQDSSIFASEDQTAQSALPVHPERIQVDKKEPGSAYQLSDLSVFRDIFPHSN